MTGLAAAWELVRVGPGVRVHVFEASSRWGGKVRTLRLDGRFEGALVETGPDSLYAIKPWALDLAAEIGLAGAVVRPDPASRRVLVWRGGKAVELPDGLFALMPARLRPFLDSPLISWLGKLRMGLEAFVPARRDGVDESLASFVRRRLGQEAVSYLAEPLLAGIHAGDPARLSTLATYPSLRRDEERYGSLLRATLARRAAGRRSLRGAACGPAGHSGKAAASPFASFRGGLGQLVDRLVELVRARAMMASGLKVCVSPAPDGRWVVDGPGAGVQEGGLFDAVILAVPAPDAARLSQSWDSPLSELLARSEYASTAVVALGFDAADVPADSVVRRSSGVLVPSAEARREGMVVTACTWASSKWPHTAPPGKVLVRCFAGRDGDDRALAFDDPVLVRRVRTDLERLAGITARPRYEAVFRWPSAMPQYRVGHLAWVSEVEHLAGRWPGLYLVGASYRGMGLSDCVRQGRAAARESLAYAQAVSRAARDRPAIRPGEERGA